MTSTKSSNERPEPTPIDSRAPSSGRAQHAPLSSSPPMSPSAFSPITPTMSSPEVPQSKSFSSRLSFQARSLTRAATTDSIFRSGSKSSRKPPPTSIGTNNAESNSSPPPTSVSPIRISSDPAITPISPAHPMSPSRPATFKKTRKTSGTTSHCGRNGNEWLFGGISVRETVKGIWKDGDGHNR